MRSGERGQRKVRGEEDTSSASRICLEVSPVGLPWQPTLRAGSVFRACAKLSPMLYLYLSEFVSQGLY